MSTTKSTHKYPSIPKRPKKTDNTNASVVSDMYNGRKNVSIQQRKESKIFGLKNFNNWVSFLHHYLF